MKSDEEIKKDLKEIDASTIQNVCNTLRLYNKMTSEYLAQFVAAVCDVDVEEMLTNTKHLQYSHARWFFWFAYHYMTKENYDSIARKTGTKRKFTVSSIGYCISKMSMMVESEPIWVKRWTIIKRVIKAILYNDNDIQKDRQTLTVKVQPPKGVDIKLQVIK